MGRLQRELRLYKLHRHTDTTTLRYAALHYDTTRPKVSLLLSRFDPSERRTPAPPCTQCAKPTASRRSHSAAFRQLAVWPLRPCVRARTVARHDGARAGMSVGDPFGCSPLAPSLRRSWPSFAGSHDEDKWCELAEVGASQADQPTAVCPPPRSLSSSLLRSRGYGRGAPPQMRHEPATASQERRAKCHDGALTSTTIDSCSTSIS